MQERDVHLLRELGVMRVVDREQAKMIGPFGSTTRANARLLALTEARYLRRFFWGTVGGAKKVIYALAPCGAEIAGVPNRGPRRSRDQVLAADFFSLHQLQVNEVYGSIKYRPLPEGVTFIRWLSFHESLPGTTLIPDGYAEVDHAEKLISFFIEVDLGNENRTVWQGKVRSYLSYGASGSFTREFENAQFRTLTVTNSESRLTSLRTATAALTEKIFRFTTEERIKREGFWGRIWQKPKGDEREALIATP
ncbi:MAG: replication-relaxation family protein [Acidobacteriaceae bacterium]|nr:replication-relaxation family protein [Acidobacteriaceae bacterium]